MTYEQLKNLKPEDFKRACGVSPPTFEEMRHVLQAYERRKIKPGRPPKLSLENRWLMALQYWREYRTYFHLGLSWGVDESVVCRTVHQIEQRLLTSPAFHVPGKRRLYAEDTPFDVVVVDAAESPGERPQKNSGATPAGRRSATPTRRRSSSPNGRARSSVSPWARGESTTSSCSSEAGSFLRKRSNV
jgi:hypothetical protein